MTPEEYRARFGAAPMQDDLHRATCEQAGQIGHLQCGLCPEHEDRPRFMCGCLPNLPERIDGWACSVDADGTLIALPEGEPDGLIPRAEARLTVLGELTVAVDGAEARLSPAVVDWLTEGSRERARDALTLVRGLWLALAPADAPRSMVEAMADLSCPECRKRNWTHKLDCGVGASERRMFGGKP